MLRCLKKLENFIYVTRIGMWLVLVMLMLLLSGCVCSPLDPGYDYIVRNYTHSGVDHLIINALAMYEGDNVTVVETAGNTINVTANIQYQKDTLNPIEDYVKFEDVNDNATLNIRLYRTHDEDFQKHRASAQVTIYVPVNTSYELTKKILGAPTSTDNT